MSATTTLPNVSPPITSTDWSLMLDSTAGGGPGSGIGNLVQAYADVNQCIKIILTTIPGEDPFRPTFGVDITQWVDTPTPAAQAALCGPVINAIQTWEPRVIVLSVTSTSPAAGVLNVAVAWQLNIGTQANPVMVGTPQTTSVPFGSNTAAIFGGI
jgi:phage baseplate assembly protein W